jgi:DNA-binding NarL/FixJ family response regulator
VRDKGGESSPTEDAGPGQSLGIVLVEPLPIIIEGLALFIDAQPDMTVLARASSANEALAAVHDLPKRTTVILLVALELTGERDGFWLIRTIRERYPTVTVIASSVNSVRTNVSRALFMGADGYINKATEPQEFLDSLRRAASGEMVLAGLPPDWFGPIVEDVVRQKDEPPSILTEREKEILRVAAEGLTARKIGDQLGVRERTVTTHLANIYKKLGVKGRGAAVAAAVREGLLFLDAPPPAQPLVARAYSGS